jgi:hypothetical protein
MGITGTFKLRHEVLQCLDFKNTYANFRRGARELLLLNPEKKLLAEEFKEFDIDWSSINAPWINVEVLEGTFAPAKCIFCCETYLRS